MYFLSDEERRYVLRKLLPEARREPVHEELRGWNWHQPPLAPIYEAPLGLWEIAGQYCSSGRDLFLRRVEQRRAAPNSAMIAGGALHSVITGLILAAKRAIYVHGRGCTSELAGLEATPPGDAEMQRLAEPAREALAAQAELLAGFERRRIISRVEDILARQPHIGPDALAAWALPVVVEQRLDGRFLGLSSHLSADAFAFGEPMIADLKFGPAQPFHRLTTTGYALVLESLTEMPIDIGCIVRAAFRDGQLRIERDFHRIDDELRQWFIEARDERMRLVEEGVDPGRPGICAADCPYEEICAET
ncbi:MAG TPA: type I-A CRISPR-associated protein Cas4/Csa1 [Anaerolineae bacterium]|nr:type I-A CRISPR-associated protein Cas4/Csa1 [Anaerolineae bacterium]HPL29232.1 type I-A CRISPR-associated protein Cas4/Csa1 [Anaerolineae bacterium]